MLDTNVAAYVVIFAGGTGTRMRGASKPKQFLELAGKPIIAHTIEHFQCHPGISSIVVACYEPCIGELERIVCDFGLSKVESVVPGGSTGQDSIYNGLLALKAASRPPKNDSVVLIHDGVRPLIDRETITRCIKSTADRGSTATTAPATETLIVADGGVVEGVVDRDKCRLARAPQGFRYGELVEAHQKARAEGLRNAVDSVSLMARFGHQIYMVSGPEENIKITTPRDYFTFKALMDMREVAQIWEL